MHFSVWPIAPQPWDQISALATELDYGFWHCLYVADHFMTQDGSPGEVLEATSVLASLAATTSRIRLGSLVLSMTYRHPAVLANWAVTVDRISGGRLTLGLGAGWQPNEHEQYGLDLGKPYERVDRFAEGLAVIEGLLTNPTTTFAGQHYQLSEASCEPKPVQAPLPLLIGAAQPRMLGLAARYGNHFNQWSVPGGFETTSRVLDAACESHGRDPASIWRSTQALTMVTHSAEEEGRAEAMAEHLPFPLIYGTALQIAEKIALWRDEGVDEVIFPDYLMPRGTDRLDSLDELAEAIAPLTTPPAYQKRPGRETGAATT
jgi:alkanesulfonate monooxygenase SsuD/methylene tetrahydromethanopterin reductase-like flavin-dependent oxidoreductase (luciferase family)